MVAVGALGRAAGPVDVAGSTWASPRASATPAIPTAATFPGASSIAAYAVAMALPRRARPIRWEPYAVVLARSPRPAAHADGPAQRSRAFPRPRATASTLRLPTAYIATMRGREPWSPALTANGSRRAAELTLVPRATLPPTWTLRAAARRRGCATGRAWKGVATPPRSSMDAPSHIAAPSSTPACPATPGTLPMLGRRPVLGGRAARARLGTCVWSTNSSAPRAATAPTTPDSAQRGSTRCRSNRCFALRSPPLSAHRWRRRVAPIRAYPLPQIALVALSASAPISASGRCVVSSQCREPAPARHYSSADTSRWRPSFAPLDVVSPRAESS
jgi:hypothetical protein